MEPSPSIRWSIPTLIFVVFLLVKPSASIYCDEDDCYDLLGVTQSANASEIKKKKKAYYKLSLKHHPDKNPDPESKKLFVKIANAYQILKDEATREQYDYAIAHPEEFSSLGSLDEKWMAELATTSMSAGMTENKKPLGLGKPLIVWPSVEDVRCSIEGYAAGNAVPSPLKNVEKEFLKKYWAKWKSSHTGHWYGSSI